MRASEMATFEFNGRLFINCCSKRTKFEERKPDLVIPYRQTEAFCCLSKLVKEQPFVYLARCYQETDV